MNNKVPFTIKANDKDKSDYLVVCNDGKVIHISLGKNTGMNIYEDVKFITSDKGNNLTNVFN